ncbi:hypothetical protein RIR_jg32107.t1 [Rhizophagus irregularis DAOM 181602=DAOM 197198]|nr:hypothetical protein RIR_jg32107.t1 [Rhizophagus irregularis DAOM 181602=DAOM 197198]
MEDIDQIFIKRNFLPNHLLKSPIVRDPSENFKLWVRTFKTTPVLDIPAFDVEGCLGRIKWSCRDCLNCHPEFQRIELIELYLLLCWVKDSINMQQ